MTTLSSPTDLTIPRQRSEAALRRVEEALDSPPDATASQLWRRMVRHRLAAVRDALVTADDESPDWLSARRSASVRRRNVLLDRLSHLGPQVLADADLDRVAYDLRRLLVDVRHHLQRLNDLAYDEVEYEVGGSE